MSHTLKDFAVNHDLEVMISKAAHGASYVGGGGTIVIAGLDLSDLGVLVGMCFTALTYFTFLYFKIKQDRREEKAAKKNAG